MVRDTRRKFALVAASALALSTVAASPALADGGHEHGNLLEAELVGSNPAPASPTIAGITPGGAPWVNGESTVRVRADGRITVRIRGLVIPTPPQNGTNPVASAVATLVCGSTPPLAGASTAPFALDTAGNGRTKDMIVVPMPCMDPTVLIRPVRPGGAIAPAYIASSMMDDDEQDD